MSAAKIFNDVTGGVPRQIVGLHRAESYEEWHQKQVQKYFGDLETEFLKATYHKRQSFLSYLDVVIEGRPEQLGLPSVTWYDRGLFYIDAGKGFVLNPIAREALDSLWRQYRYREVIGKTEQTGSAIGATFEHEVRRGFFKCQSQIELKPYYLKTEKNGTENKEPAKSLLISTITRMISFKKDTEIPRPRPPCCILQPTSETYSGVDFIIEDSVNKQIVFVQTTMELPHQHEKKMKLFENLFTSGKIKNILDNLFQVSSTEVTVDNKAHFIIKLPESAGWQVKFLYITGQLNADVKEKCHWNWKDVVVAGRETIRPLNLLFHEWSKKKRQKNTHI